jgi:hypothetical protein
MIYKINRNFINFLLSVVLFFIFLSFEYSFLTDDYKTYKLYFLSDSNELEDGSRVEFLYFLLSKLFYKVGFNFELFYLCTIFVCTYVFVDKYTELTRLIGGFNFQIFIPVIFLFTLFENFSTVIFRSYIAATLVVFGLLQLLKGNYKKYFICAFFGVGIHFLSIFSFLIILLSYFQAINKSYKYLRLYTIFICLLFLLFLFNKDYIANIFILFINNYFSYYSIYNTGTNNFFSEIDYFKVTTLVLFFFTVIVIFKKKLILSNIQKFIAFFMANCLLFTVLVPFPNIRSRLFIYIQMMLIIFLIRYLNLLGLNVVLSIIFVLSPFVFINFF